MSWIGFGTEEEGQQKEPGTLEKLRDIQLSEREAELNQMFDMIEASVASKQLGSLTLI